MSIFGGRQQNAQTDFAGRLTQSRFVAGFLLPCQKSLDENNPENPGSDAKLKDGKLLLHFLQDYSIFCVALCKNMLIRCLIHFFIAHILYNLLQYMLTLAIREARVGYVRAAA